MNTSIDACYSFAMPKIILNNGFSIPPIGLGTWHMKEGQDAEHAVAEALKIGYRLIDTAKYYGNEASIGKAVRESAIPREEIFVTTKLWPTDFFNPERAFRESFEQLGLEYIDLYLVHYPVPLMPTSIWKVLERMVGEKLVRSIGVSNYDIEALRHTLSYAKILPAVNQVRFSPFDFKQDLLAFCKEYDVALEAYSPLTRGIHLKDKDLKAIAQKHGKTPAQIMIRWCVQHGTIPIPKSSHPERMRENLDVFNFVLDSADMAALDVLSP